MALQIIDCWHFLFCSIPKEFWLSIFPGLPSYFKDLTIWRVNNETHNNVWKLSFENKCGKERQMVKRGVRNKLGNEVGHNEYIHEIHKNMVLIGKPVESSWVD